MANTMSSEFSDRESNVPSISNNISISVPSIIKTIDRMTRRVQAHLAARVKPTPIIMLTMPSIIIAKFSGELNEKIETP